MQTFLLNNHNVVAENLKTCKICQKVVPINIAIIWILWWKRSKTRLGILANINIIIIIKLQQYQISGCRIINALWFLQQTHMWAFYPSSSSKCSSGYHDDPLLSKLEFWFVEGKSQTICAPMDIWILFIQDQNVTYLYPVCIQVKRMVRRIGI